MKLKRIITATLAAIVLLSPLEALADKAYITSNTVVYMEPDTSSRSAKLSSGTKLELLGEKDGWAKVKQGGKTGYVDASKVALVENEDAKTTTLSGYAKYDGVKVYKSSKTSSKVLAKLSLNDEVQVSSAKGKWCKVVNGSAVAYVLKADLAKSPVSVAEPTPEVTKAPVKTQSGYAKFDGVKVYESHETSSEVLATLSINDEVQVSSAKGKWCQVINGGTVAYVPAANLAKSPVSVATTEPEPTKAPVKTLPGYAKRDGVKVYKSFSTASEVLATLSLNGEVQVCDTKGKWCQIVKDESVAYVRMQDLSKTQVAAKPESYTAYAKVEGAKVYKKHASDSKVLMTLPINFEFTVLVTNGNWAQVRNGSDIGYMQLAELSKTKVELTPPAATATGYAKYDDAKVYKSASTSSEVLTTLSVNDSVGVSAAKDGWCQVINGDNVGYMQESALSTSRVEVLNATGYVKNNGAKVYATASTSAEVLGTLDINTQINITGASGDWCRVKNGASIAFMKAADLSSEKVADQTVLKYGDKGDLVKKMQSRLKELGYFAGTVGGNYMGITQSAVSSFQTVAKLTVNGVADEKTLNAMFSDGAPKNTSSGGSNVGYSTATPATGTAKGMDWWTSDIQKIFARGTVATVTDVSTGIAWFEKRTGGTNHADVQPLTASDTKSMKKAAGSWSWTRRAIFVTINGVNYAASMNCMPHGSGSIKSNNFDGHHCIHFTNSRTHGGNKKCSLHQNAIKKALNASL